MSTIQFQNKDVDDEGSGYLFLSGPVSRTQVVSNETGPGRSRGGYKETPTSVVPVNPRIWIVPIYSETW